MYSPSYYKAEDQNLIRDVIRNYGFATVFTLEQGKPFISHLPLLLEENGTSLIGHCARANPQWKHFAEGQVVTSVFNGPHAYISPAWYEPDDANVPTWNYVTVHTSGPAQILTDPDQAYDVLRKSVALFESKYATGWQLPEVQNRELESLSRAIVAFRIEIKEIDAKFKLSQKQSSTNRNSVIHNLPLLGEEAAAVADFMKRVTK
jgi:transcriptional regulator